MSGRTCGVSRGDRRAGPDGRAADSVAGVESDLRGDARRHQARRGRAGARRARSIATELWGAEASPGSASALRPRPPRRHRRVEWTYQLAGGTPAGQYAAYGFLWRDWSGTIGCSCARAPAVRAPLGAGARFEGRQRRPVGPHGLSRSERPLVDVKFDELEPLGATSQPTTAARPDRRHPASGGHPEQRARQRWRGPAHRTLAGGALTRIHANAGYRSARSSPR